jgi:N4-gp56 family major capsid protein
MADAFTTFSNLALDVANVYIATEVYEVAERQMVLSSMGRKEKLPQRNSKTIRLVRFKRFDLPTAPLVEGVPPDAVQLVTENVDITVDQWGIVGLLTDVGAITTQHDALRMMTKRCGTAIAEVIERETARTLLGGGVVRYAGGAASRAALTGAIFMTTSDATFATVTLRSLGATDMSNGLYDGVMPPQVEGDIFGNDTIFTAAAQQTQLRALQYAEIGIWQGVRWKRGNFLPYFQSVAAPTAAAADATKAQITAVDGGGTITSATNFKFGIVGRDRTTDYERRISIASANIASAMTANNESFSVVLPTSVNYVYDVYMSAAGGSGALFLVGSRKVAGSTFVITAEPSAAAATMPAAVGDTAGDEVFISFVFGEDAFFTVELNGMSTESYITPDTATYSNPLKQGRKVGTKVSFKAGIIDPNFYVRIESNSRYASLMPA